MWYKNKRCASKSDNRTSAQRICEYGTIRHILPTQHLWKCGWPKSKVTLWHHLCQWDIATKKDKRWISVPITLNINPQNTWERRVVELFFFLYIFRRAKLQMWTIFFSPDMWVSGHCSFFCTSWNTILLVFPWHCNKKPSGWYGLDSRSAKSHYVLYYIQMWSGGNERLYSTEGTDFHSSASVCTHLHLCSHIQ